MSAQTDHEAIADVMNGGVGTPTDASHAELAHHQHVRMYRARAEEAKRRGDKPQQALAERLAAAHHRVRAALLTNPGSFSKADYNAAHAVASPKSLMGATSKVNMVDGDRRGASMNLLHPGLHSEAHFESAKAEAGGSPALHAQLRDENIQAARKMVDSNKPAAAEHLKLAAAHEKLRHDAEGPERPEQKSQGAKLKQLASSKKKGDREAPGKIAAGREYARNDKGEFSS